MSNLISLKQYKFKVTRFNVTKSKKDINYFAKLSDFIKITQTRNYDSVNQVTKWIVKGSVINDEFDTYGKCQKVELRAKIIISYQDKVVNEATRDNLLTKVNQEKEDAIKEVKKLLEPHLAYSMSNYKI